MKTINIVGVILAPLLLLSCKKDKESKKEEVQKIQITATDLFYRGDLDYEHAIAQIVGERMRIVVPIKSEEGQKSFRYKISEYVKDGIPDRSGFILSLKEITKKTDLFAIPINSKGSYFTNTKENSLTKDQRGKILAKVKSDKGEVTKPLGEVLSLYAGCGDVPPFCVDWYYVTYDQTTGNVVNEIYLYSTCYDPCSFNSNPNGGGSSGENCSNVANQLKGGPISTQVGIGLIDEGISERKYAYTWGFYKQINGMWEFRSIEVGTHKKQPDNTWRWKSLVHDRVTKIGWTLGGTVDCQATGVSVVGLYVAGMQLDYTITASAVCKGSPLSWNVPGRANSPIWHVDYRPPES